MKKLALATALLLGAFVLAAPPADAQICIDFTLFCDGLELTASGGSITGFWRNTDCAGTDVAIVGAASAGSIPNECGPNGNAGVVCDAGINGCSVAGQSWWFVFDSLDGTLDMNNGFPGAGTCWIPALEYTSFMGACPFVPNDNSGPLASSAQ